MIIDAFAAYLAARNIPFSRPSPSTLRLGLHPEEISFSPSGIVTVRDEEGTISFPFESAEDLHKRIASILSTVIN